MIVVDHQPWTQLLLPLDDIERLLLVEVLRQLGVVVPDADTKTLDYLESLADAHILVAQQEEHVRRRNAANQGVN